MDPFEAAKLRREHLRVARNPRPGLEFIVTLEGRMTVAAFGAPVEVGLRYIPERDIVAPGALGDYLEALSAHPWPSLEDLGQILLGDINSELVPRWAQVKLSGRVDGQLHSVVLEDRQPKWDNPKLMSRLPSM